MIGVLIADDHGVVRSGLAMLIERQSDMSIVGEAADGIEAVDLALAVRPDVAVLDVSMPGLTGPQAARQIHGHDERIALLMLSMHEDERYFFDALDAGALGYVPKRAADSDLIGAIRTVAGGRTFVSSSTQQALMRRWLEGSPDERREQLTARELEVVKLIAEAHTNRQIAEALKVSEKTVESHRGNVLAKLGMRDRVELARYAIRRGLGGQSAAPGGVIGPSRAERATGPASLPGAAYDSTSLATLDGVNPRIVIALVVVAVAAFAAVALAAGSADDGPGDSGERFAGATLPEGLMAPELGLRDEEGEVVRMSELRGEPAIVTFLYSNCDDSCPAQAQQVKGALNELGRDLPALAISVDPANDTADSARAFLSEQRMTGRMRFVLGTRPELRRVWRGYAIQPQLDDLDHTARIVLVDGDGVQRVGYPLGEVTPERLAHDLRLLAAGR